jgi:methyl-accepting chemotaxis protein
MEAARIVMSGMWLQDVDSLSSGNSRLLMIFVGLVALAMLTQAIVFVVFAVLAAKTQKKLMVIAEDLRVKTAPVIEGAQDIIRDAVPKVKIITENLVETSHVVRAKAQEVDVTLSEVNQRTRAQAARVDGMVSSVLTTTADIASSIQKGVQVPVREFQGLVNGFKAGVDVLVGRAKGFGRDGAKSRSQSDDRIDF